MLRDSHSWWLSTLSFPFAVLSGLDAGRAGHGLLARLPRTAWWTASFSLRGALLIGVIFFIWASGFYLLLFFVLFAASLFSPPPLFLMAAANPKQLGNPPPS